MKHIFKPLPFKTITIINGDSFNWTKNIYDKNGNNIYHEDSTGYWSKRDYDNKGRVPYWENSDGAWEKMEYDENGKRIYYENSNGIIIQ